MTPDRSLAGDDRGVSEVVGYVLVISLVITTVGVISVSGIGVLQDAREAEQIENAKRAFDLLADNMEDVYREGAPSRSTEIQLGSAQLVAQQTTTLNVSYLNSTNDRVFRQLQLSSITYRGDSNQRLVYDGGAVFRFSEPDSTGVVLRQPPFVVTDDRAVFSVPRPTTGATTAVSGSTALVRATQTSQRTLVRSAQNNDNIWVNITSPHWRAWQTSLDNRQNIACDPPNSGGNTLRCELTVEPAVFYLAETQIRVSLTR